MKLLLIFIIFQSSLTFANEITCSLEQENPSFKEVSNLINETSTIYDRWATDVHNYFIDTAFADLSTLCRSEMKAGSIYADSFRFQDEEFSHMHAMRIEGESIEVAKKKMLDYVMKKYKEVNEYEKKYKGKLTHIDERMNACFHRGMALHPIMDFTSPCHKGFQIWDNTDLSELMKHGNLREIIIELVGVGFGIPHSDEDMRALKNQPDLEESTIKLMKSIDKSLFKEHVHEKK